jgi:hypothetical protein
LLALQKPTFCGVGWGSGQLHIYLVASTVNYTIELAKKFIDIGRGTEYADEMDWLPEILSWPVECSALHRIAEIKTPVLKASPRTDATPCKYTVRRQGDSYPLEGIRGLNFPYRLPLQRILNGSRELQRGLDHKKPSLKSLSASHDASFGNLKIAVCANNPL